MQVEFTKNGVFTSKGKVKAGDKLELPDKEVNLFLQKGWVKPIGDVQIVESEPEEAEEVEEAEEDDSQD
ncbi:unnamed protein product [marine sediment metagenome]|uniref:Uncharacterized protein n=1 Tax=marine sediment metagenome TaxID=412755 RepID=X0V5Q5_9ZZZZ